MFCCTCLPFSVSPKASSVERLPAVSPAPQTALEPASGLTDPPHLVAFYFSLSSQTLLLTDSFDCKPKAKCLPLPPTQLKQDQLASGEFASSPRNLPGFLDLGNADALGQITLRRGTLCTAGCLAGTAPPRGSTKNISGHCQISPGGQNPCWLTAAAKQRSPPWLQIRTTWQVT